MLRSNPPTHSKRAGRKQRPAFLLHKRQPSIACCQKTYKKKFN